MKITIENPITGYEKIKSITIDTINDLDGNDVVEILAGLMMCNGWQQKTIAECFEDYAYEHLPQIEREEEEAETEEPESLVITFDKGTVI